MTMSDKPRVYGKISAKEPTEQQIWEAALIKADVWKRHECILNYIRPEMEGRGLPDWCRIHKRYEHADPAPTIGDAEATLKMLEWLRQHDPFFMLDVHGDAGEWWVKCEHHSPSLALALAAAVLEVPQP
jgi:hypothetical protein